MPKEILYILTCVIGYLLGSISGGIITSRLANGPDLHTVGSKSTGASNVQRTMGWKYGIITFLIDGLKGIFACLIAWLITGSHFASLLAGLFCVIGHNWPVFFHFRGGKGVATTGGVMLYCFPVPALICIALTVAVIALFRYISVGSMLLVTVFFILSFFFSGPNTCVVIWAFLLMVMCIARHHANIGRLIHGKENKLGNKVK
ncbi:glycerol-3-phosphate 1-O-acyltransferase PlsY [Aristaeella hokkaidonensis]|uniref:Glycerol-3-phosphate 1-O-acyltransferase PlsY n=1 Tax=Aristaeella hokkaidonensis TaxID=3046382 RepID=A0AC61MYA8_9FIRM|nr:glycerol-3-phosphate 1-O-acyltransferase PlsY [Aristaeella hokkaidonensis]QUC67986.1 glycerol-3-phosphate 1-O-acyltransferase PlsY [Aristaeella hokkaidonensis]SNT93055.1 acyl-phosphate glycerol-3-phosphate acyltransferase [Aristaeella hokkaidonensis]